MLLEQFLRTVEGMPDPRELEPEDALDLLIGLVDMAKTVEVEPGHVDKRWACARCFQIIDEDPVFVRERAYHEQHAPKRAEVGPPLGRAPRAERPGGR